MAGVEILRATAQDMEILYGILNEAARWIHQRGIDQWQYPFNRERIEKALAEHEVYLARQDGEPVGTLTLQWADTPFWGDWPDDAGYVHLLASLRKGVGRRLLAWAETETVRRGRTLLRLDCVATNPKLVQYYEQAGYEGRGEVFLYGRQFRLLEKRLGQILSLQVGRPRPFGEHPEGQSVQSAFAKEPVSGPVWLGRTNFAGDQQADLRHHGGHDKAVLAYAGGAYEAWRGEGLDLPFGAFGENLTISGQDEATVCLGDIYAVGEALLQVAQPRIPCWKISHRWQIPDLAQRVERTGRTGWYLRVLQEGWVEAGQAVALVDRPCPAWPIRRVQEVLALSKQDGAAGLELAAVPVLAEMIRKVLLARAGQ